MSLVEMCDDMDIRWITDDRKSYEIVLSYLILQDSEESMPFSESFENKTCFPQQTPQKALLPQHIVNSLSKSC